MPGNGSTSWMMLLPCKKKKLFLSLAMQIILILTILCRGIGSQAGVDYTVTVPSSVSVQRGLIVHIPCQFTYDKNHLSRNDYVFAYWFKSELQWFCLEAFAQDCVQGLLVATSDKRQIVHSSAKDRFYFIGDSHQGSCSVIIIDARIEDEGQYYLRIQGSGRIKFSFVQEKGHTSPRVYVIEPSQKVNITVDITSPGHYDSSGQQRKEALDHVVAQEGDTVHLLCTADGRPHPNLSWMKGNKTIGQSKNSTKNSFQLSRIGPEDAGEYQCLANNQHGSVKTMVKVIVQYRPRTVIFKVTQTHRRGSTLTQGCSRDLATDSELTAQEGDLLGLFCKADSNPPAKTSWVKSGSHLQNPSEDNQLELTNLTIEDEGVYACKATNSLGFVQGNIRLNVAYAPKLSRSPQKNTTCCYHNHGFLCSCSLHGQPPPQIEWEVDGERITKESSRRQNLVVQALIQRNEVTSTLNWTGSLDRAHNIICFGSNSYGIHTMQFLLNALRDPTSESSIGRSNTALFIAALCGTLLGAGIMLGLYLIRVYKQKEAMSKVEPVEGTLSEIGHRERPKNPSQIYSNIFPMGPRLHQIDQPKVAGERKPNPAQVPSVPRRAEPDELQYATLEFKVKSKEVPVSRSDNVEYSAIQRK
ncbi:sialic acid-binding Ig-like lectin 10 [Python bivittatus]|uniref:Sialic acid-binding Ig-like lectin 10 n=1 Tax=Python bivittatus TaxID=176946 RepID=A0A9F2RB96_PYTBI|nr:sialic acid-binding Ig-like lectin 10 [Python bivittatus]